MIGLCQFFDLKCSDELGRFVSDRRMLKSLKMEGCSNLGGFVLCSTSLSTLWLSDLSSHSKMVIVFYLLLPLSFVSCALLILLSCPFLSAGVASYLIPFPWRRFLIAPI